MTTHKVQLQGGPYDGETHTIAMGYSQYRVFKPQPLTSLPPTGYLAPIVGTYAQTVHEANGVPLFTWQGWNE